jgi:hypothetical protein
MQKGSPVMLVAIIVMAVAGLVMVNVFQEKNQPKTEAQMQAEQEKQQAEEQKKQAANATPAPPVKAEGSPDDLVLQEGELKLGDSAGQHEMILAYEWTPEVQADPTQVSNIISKMKIMPKMRIRVINADASEEMTPGLYMDGKLMNANPLAPGADAEILGNLKQMMGH